jgi:apolipoprotein N-acyltransferase
MTSITTQTVGSRQPAVGSKQSAVGSRQSAVEGSARRFVSASVAVSVALPSALLLYLCFFPVAWGALAWGALVPLLLLVRCRCRPVVVYAAAMLAGLAFYFPVLQWMRVADDMMYFAWIFLATYCSLYLPAALFFLRYLDRRTRLPLALTAPVVWTALEYLRCQFGTGFSWYLIGHALHDYLGLIQIADITGAFGVSFLVVLVNGLFAEALLLWAPLRAYVAGPDAPPRYSRVAVLVQTGIAALLLVGVCGYGVYRLGQNDFGEGPRIALIQGNLDQRIRNDRSKAETAGQHFVALCDLASHIDPQLALIVWPETSYPPTWKEDPPGVPSDFCAKDAAEMARIWKQPVLLGLKSDIPDEHGQRVEYNSALLLVGGQAVARYDKMHLVPLGEYVPFRETLPVMKKLSPYDFDYSVESGRQHTRFPLRDERTGKDYTFGVLICYEDTDPDVARPYGGGDGRPPADFLLNTSNDGWFNGTSEHEQHLAVCRFRAIECRRSVARSVNMGISAVIDPNGHVLPPRDIMQVQPTDPSQPPVHIWGVDPRKTRDQDMPSSRWTEFKKVSGILEASIPIDTRTSFYARYGDWLPWSCWSVLGVALFGATVRRLRPA